MNTAASLDILGPVDQFPAEGYSEETSSERAIDCYTSALSGSTIGFEISPRGVVPTKTKPGGEVFQRFEISTDEFVPSEDAFQIDLADLITDHARFDDISDAAEPKDYVRRFLETAGRSLDSNSELAADGNVRHVPLIRWQPPQEENTEGARVQLLGILQATDEQFEAFCASSDGSFEAILEDSEVEGRGLRETGMALAILGISIGMAPDAEAGLFKKVFKKHREAKAERLAEKRAVRRVEAPIQKQSSGFIDVHNDARINNEILQAYAGQDVERNIVVDVQRQRAYLLVDGHVAIDTAVSTARTGKETPRGQFTITEKIRTGKRSTIYGCEMPCWMRLDSSEYGMHVGDLPGRPASAGCVRLPHSVAPILFENAASGTVVQIVDSWEPVAQQRAPMLASTR